MYCKSAKRAVISQLGGRQKRWLTTRPKMKWRRPLINKINDIADFRHQCIHDASCHLHEFDHRQTFLPNMPRIS